MPYNDLKPRREPRWELDVEYTRPGESRVRSERFEAQDLVEVKDIVGNGRLVSLFARRGPITGGASARPR